MREPEAWPRGLQGTSWLSKAFKLALEGLIRPLRALQGPQGPDKLYENLSKRLLNHKTSLRDKASSCVIWPLPRYHTSLDERPLSIPRSHQALK